MQLLIILTYSVLLDDTDMFKRNGGQGYEYFGIDADQGALVIVRPDGYVGIVAPFDKVDEVESYFSGFMKL